MGTDVTRHRFTVEDYHAMGRVGILHEDDRVELIEGEIVEMSPIGSNHAACVKRLNRRFTEGLGDRAVVSVQDPVRINHHSEPEPDLAVLHPRLDYYASGHPAPEDVLLIVEVAETSAGYDRHVKLPLYARSGIPEVWIVDLAAREIERFRHPSADGYGTAETLQSGDELTAEHLPELRLDAADLVEPA